MQSNFDAAFLKKCESNRDNDSKVRSCCRHYGYLADTVPFWDKQTRENFPKPFIEDDLRIFPKLSHFGTVKAEC
jgi:hypothetical protein